MSLTSTGIKALKAKDKKCRVTDGQGLKLEVSPASKKRWLYRYTQDAKRKTITIGHYPGFSLSDSRASQSAQVVKSDSLHWATLEKFTTPF